MLVLLWVLPAITAATPVLVRCSMQMSQWLLQQGFRNVRNVTGGIDAYSRGVDSSVPTY